MDVNFTFSSQHSKPCSQISMPLEDVVQHRLEVITQVMIMTDKLLCPAVFNSGLYRTLVITEYAIGVAGGYDKGINSPQYRGREARMIGTFRLIKGEAIHIFIGQEGGINKMYKSSGGGGGTFVVRGANTPLIIAGGGGGVQYGFSKHTKCDASTSTTGNPEDRPWSGGSNGQGKRTF